MSGFNYIRFGLQRQVNVLLANANKCWINGGSSHRLFVSRSNINAKSNKTLFLLGSVGVGALVGAGYSYQKIKETKVPVADACSKCEGLILEALPNIKPSRTVVGSTDNLKLTLYQYQTCPFCCKVRAFLDYHGFSYDIVEVNPVLRQQIKWSQYKKVPILIAQVENGYQQLVDSTMIISALTSYAENNDATLNELMKCYPMITFKDTDGKEKVDIMNRYSVMTLGKDINRRSKEQTLEEIKWRKWADEVLVHTLSPNVYRTWEEALQAFNWFSKAGEWEKHFADWERYLVIYVGAAAMLMVGKRLKKKYSLKEDVRSSLYDECTVWVRHLRNKGTRFAGGESPNLADLAVYGVLNSIEGCDAFKDLLTNTKIGSWYRNMQDEVKCQAGKVAMQS